MGQKATVFAPINPYSLVYCLQVRAKPTRGDYVNSRVDSGLTCKHSNNLERPARDKHSSLFVWRVGNEGKMFCYIDTDTNIIKKLLASLIFNVRNKLE